MPDAITDPKLDEQLEEALTPSCDAHVASGCREAEWAAYCRTPLVCGCAPARNPILVCSPCVAAFQRPGSLLICPGCRAIYAFTAALDRLEKL